MTSKAFGSTTPVHPHLIAGAGGLPKEIADVRADVEAAFETVETAGPAGSSPLVVEEWVNVAAKHGDRHMLTQAFAATAKVITGTSLTGVTVSPPRNLILSFTISAGAGAGTVAVTGTDVDGNAVHEHFTVPAGTSDVVGNYAFATVTQVDMCAIVGGAFAGSLIVGEGDKIGLGAKVMLRNAAPAVLVEIVNGVMVLGSGGGATTAVNQSTTPTTSGTAVTTDSTTAVNTATATANFCAVTGAPVAAIGDNILAAAKLFADAAGLTISADAQPDVPRNLTVYFGLNWDGGNIIITGTDQFDAAAVETFTTGSAVTRTGVKIFKTISALGIAKGVQGAVNVAATVGVGNKLGLSSVLSSATGILAVTGVAEAGTWDSTYHAVLPTSVPNAARTYTAVVPSTITPVQSGHTHTVAAHTHTAIHTHVQDPHTHTGVNGTFATPTVGAPYGTYTPASIPNATNDYCLVYERDPS